MRKILKTLWAGWKYFAHIIGVVNTRIILTILYFVLFGFVSIILFVLRNDLLQRRRKIIKQSFWKAKEPQKLDLNLYKHQF